MTYQEALKLTQDANEEYGVRVMHVVTPPDGEQRYFLVWSDLILVTNITAKHFALYQDRIENGTFVIGPAPHCEDGKTITYADDLVGLWKES